MAPTDVSLGQHRHVMFAHEMGCSSYSSPKMAPSNQDCEQAGAQHQVPQLSPGSAARGSHPRAVSFPEWRVRGPCHLLGRSMEVPLELAQGEPRCDFRPRGNAL